VRWSPSRFTGSPRAPRCRNAWAQAAPLTPSTDGSGESSGCQVSRRPLRSNKRKVADGEFMCSKVTSTSRLAFSSKLGQFGAGTTAGVNKMLKVDRTDDRRITSCLRAVFRWNESAAVRVAGATGRGSERALPPSCGRGWNPQGNVSRSRQGSPGSSRHDR
jgi:hypothetical protein